MHIESDFGNIANKSSIIDAMQKNERNALEASGPFTSGPILSTGFG